MAVLPFQTVAAPSRRAPGLPLAGGRRYALFFARLKGCDEILALIRAREHGVGEGSRRAGR